MRNKDRPGDKFEREMADKFNKIGFKTKIHVFIKNKGGKKSEQDVLAERDNRKILIQCKDYAKYPVENISQTIQKLVEMGEHLKTDRLVLAITGCKDIAKYIDEANEKGVYIWDEIFWRKLHNLNKKELEKEIGKSLEFEEVIEYINKIERDQLKKIEEQVNFLSNPQLREEVYNELKNIPFSEETKKIIELKRIGECVNSLKIIELEEKIKRENLEKLKIIEDADLEDLFKRLNNSSSLNNQQKYFFLEKIQNKMEWSEESNRILSKKELEIFLEKLEEDSVKGKEWDEFDSTRSGFFLNLEKLYCDSKILKKDKILIENEIVNFEEKLDQYILDMKTSLEILKIKINDDIKKAIFRKKFYKTSIALSTLAIISFILWRVLF